MFTKRSQDVKQPSHGERTGCLQPQQVVFTPESPTGPLDTPEPFVKLPGQNTPRLTDLHSRPLPFEQLTVEPHFKGADMSADRARRNIEHFSGFTEGVYSRSDFKGAQGMSGGKDIVSLTRRRLNP